VRSSLVLALALAGCAKGDKLGQLDLQTKDAAFALDAQPGDTLHFRMDISVTAPSQAGKSNRDSKYPIYDAMKRSTINLSLKDAAGQVRTTSCGAFETGALSSSQSGNQISKDNMPLDCTIAVTSAGRHTLSGSAAWDPLLVPNEAKLEVRREKRDTK
jgi:hypothetical protein